MLSAVTHGPKETLEFGSRLGSVAEQGLIISLSGSLGVGKTWLAKGIASTYAQIDVNEITSPAFNLVHEYGGARRRRVVHIDFYRLDELNTSDALLFDEYLTDEEALTIVEWGERFLPSLVSTYLQVDVIADPSDETVRLITMSSVGDDGHIQALLQRMESV
jgi:tRNA threonylcarbamoyladenosine biosynthesis protein TsaE